ncbi:MAG: STAS domain-containing protein [Sumerlaeia bacterium]
MSKKAKGASSPEQDIHCAVLSDDDIAVVRVHGRGSFQNSVFLERFAKHLQEQGRPAEFIVDLGECETLDSTFMGMLASVSQTQKRAGRHQLVVVNVNDHVRRLLKTLGLTYLLEIHESETTRATDALAKADLKPAEQEDISRLDQILHTLEAHKTLVELDGENEVRFQSVIHYLERSVKNMEKGKEF